jgi:hypothetical protein
VETQLARLIGALLAMRGLVVVFVSAALLALGLRALILLVVDRGHGWLVSLLRLAAALGFLGLGLPYAALTGTLVVWTPVSIGLALATAALVLVGLPRHLASRHRARAPGAIAALLQLSLLLVLSSAAGLTLMNAGFLVLSQDRPTLLIDVTGQVRPQLVRWASPNRSPREAVLETHQVVFRTPEGAAVAEAWVYGDQVAVKGRVLRLSPALNAAGIPNLFELQFAHNGYFTSERHGALPHMSVPLPPSGPLAVHPWWRPLQNRLFEAWEHRTDSASTWAIRSVTSESTYYSLVDGSGRPMRETFRLVLTPGGLSSS